MRPLATAWLTAILLCVVALTVHSADTWAAAGFVGQAEVMENAPAADATDARSSPLIWLIPLIMGLFGLGLAFVIRRFSRPERQPEAQEDIEKPGN